MKSANYEGIQALRFIAALMVVFTHATFYASERMGAGEVWARGAMGVDIFFVISGFVMVVSSQREAGWIGWRDFVYRRVVRILPPYWVATTINLLVLIAIPSAVLHSTLDVGPVIKSYLLIPDFNSDGSIEPLLGVGWTLYFESFFYAVFALALAIRLNPIWSVTSVMIAVAALSLLRTSEWPPVSVYLNPIVLEFAAGMLLAKFATVLRAPLWAALAVIVIGFIAILFVPSGTGLPRAFLFGIPSAAIVFGAILIEPYVQGRKWMAPMVFLGAASYVLYLFHPLVAPAAPMVLSRIGFNSVHLAVALSVLSAVVFAAIVYQFAELRFLDFVRARRTTKPARNGLLPS